MAGRTSKKPAKAPKKAAAMPVAAKRVVGKLPAKRVVAKPPADSTLRAITGDGERDILAYNAAQSAGDRLVCDALARTITQHVPDAERKIWHRHPVWFLDGNPIVGYGKLKDCIRLLFWSGQSFGEPGLIPEGSFKAAEVRFTSVDEIQVTNLRRWLEKATEIQWDYKNIMKRRGRLEKLKGL